MAGLSIRPITKVKTVDKESAVTFTCEALLSTRVGLKRFCYDLIDLQEESQEDLTVQFAMAMKWIIDGMGPFNSTESLTPALTERGFSILTNCSFDAHQLFAFSRNVSLCLHQLVSNMIPHCSSLLNITRVKSNSNVRLQCSVRLLQCSEVSEHFIDTSPIAYLRLQGMCDRLIIVVAHFQRYLCVQ